MKLFNIHLILLYIYNSLYFCDCTLPLLKGSGSGSGPKRPDDEDWQKGKTSSSGDKGSATSPSFYPSQVTKTSSVPPIWLMSNTTTSKVIFPFPYTTKSKLSTITTTLSTIKQTTTTSHVSVACSNYKSSSNLLPYEPVCNANKPFLYVAVQRNKNDFFCVDTKTGAIKVGTIIPATVQSISCHPITFQITLGFQLAWDKRYSSPNNNKYNNLRNKVNDSFNSLYNNPESDYQGLQTVEIVQFRRGSVIADILLTSIAHPESLNRDYQKFKQILDEKVASGNFAGHDTILRYYTFSYQRSKNAYNKVENSSQEDETVVYAGQKSAPTTSSHVPYDNNQQQITYNMADSGAQQNSKLATAGQNLFESPGILAAIVAGGVGGLLLVVLLVLYCVYRIRKSDEGSYSLDPSKKAPPTVMYQRAPTREFYA